MASRSVRKQRLQTFSKAFNDALGVGETRGAAITITWHILAAISIPLTLSQLRLSESFWELDAEHRWYLASLGGTYLAMAISLYWWTTRRERVGYHHVAVMVLAFYTMLHLSLVASASWHSRSILVLAVSAAFVSAAVSLDLRTRLGRVLLPAVLLSNVGLVASGLVPTLRVVPEQESSTVYRLALTTQDGLVPSEVTGGAIEVLEPGFLVATGDGGIFHLQEDTGSGLLVSNRLAYRVPVNGVDRFRVMDVLVEKMGNQLRLFASHHHWKGDQNCFTVRVL